MEEFVLFSLENTRVKPGTVLIKTELSGDSLSYIQATYKASI